MNMDQPKRDIATVGSEGVHTRDLYSRVYGYLKELSTYRASGLTPEEATELGAAMVDGRLLVLAKVPAANRQKFAADLREVFNDWAVRDPSVGIFGMNDVERALADAILGVLTGEDDVDGL